MNKTRQSAPVRPDRWVATPAFGTRSTSQLSAAGAGSLAQMRTCSGSRVGVPTLTELATDSPPRVSAERRLDKRQMLLRPAADSGVRPDRNGGFPP